MEASKNFGSKKDNPDNSQGFNSRNQYSGSGDFSPDQEELQNDKDDFDAGIGGSIKQPDRKDSAYHTDNKNQSDDL
jgi:hypothetical protein